MIVEKTWITEERRMFLKARKTWRGWFLFGIIPLYIKMIKLETFD